jgi:general secretion pathway protein F/type IV pilus assembly protein PilC
MLHNGIPILKALNIAKDSTGNRILSLAIAKSAENVTAGQKLADPLRRSGYFPPDVVEMITIAEEANSLERKLIDIATVWNGPPGTRIDGEAARADHAARDGRVDPADRDGPPLQPVCKMGSTAG